jgi:FixJ family two-component response regulator
MSNIEQSPQENGEHNTFTYPSPVLRRALKSIETPAEEPSLASAFAVHGKVSRKRRNVSSQRLPRIFVVDDERLIASTLAVIFNRNGYSARCFTEPMEALAAAHSDVPDLLISDVAMSGCSGVDLAIAMRAQYPQCKIMLFSGQVATQGLLENARAQGHDFHLLPKPVHPSELLARMETLRDETAPTESARTTHGIPALLGIA